MSMMNRLLKGNVYGLDPYLMKDILASCHKHTPDYPFLERYEFLDFFLWGDTMSGHRAHGIVDGLQMHNGFTEKPYIMLKKQLGKAVFPLVLDVPEKRVAGDIIGRATPAPISGQIFTIRPYLVPELDKYMANTVEYHRKRVDILIPFYERRRSAFLDRNFRPFFTKTQTSPLQFYRKRAWMYTADLEHYMSQSNYDDRWTNEGLLKTRPNNQKYISKYHFTRDDF